MNKINDNLGYEISNPPTDTISQLKFSNINKSNRSGSEKELLMASSWDNKIYIYANLNIKNNLIFTRSFNYPQLDCCFENNNYNYVYSVGLDCELKRINLEKSQSEIIYTNSNPINGVIYDDIIKSVFTYSSWDNFIVMTDPLSKNIEELKIDLNIHKMIVTTNRKLIAAGLYKNNLNFIKVFDLRNFNNSNNNNLSNPILSYESNLKFQTSSLSDIIINDGFVIGSIEGKISVEYFENLIKENVENNVNKNNVKNYAFKCHREEVENKTFVYSVNSINFHPCLNIFYSSGSDKFIYGWDNLKKKKIYKSQQYPNPINSIAINNNGTIMAIASSDNYQNLHFDNNSLNTNNKEISLPKIFIQNLN